MFKLLFGAAIGAALAYFLDPDRGKRRRNVTRDRLMGLARHTGERLEDQARYATSTAQGLYEKAVHMGGEQGLPADDAALAHKVESEVFRDPNFPKGKININAENGVVVLRGELDRPEEINALEKKVREIPGVYAVENLLHLPDTPAQMS
jgi:osmotically-inducible protein OsmY